MTGSFSAHGRCGNATATEGVMARIHWIRQRARLAAMFVLPLLASCDGGGGGKETPDQQATSNFFQQVPNWADYSPPVPDRAPGRVGDPVQTNETVEVPIMGEQDGKKVIIGHRTEDYGCKSTKFSMTETPEKIVMFSPDRELLWPGSLIQGKSHRDGLGSLLPLTIRERAPIKVSIPSLATPDNFRLIEVPDQAEVNQAIGSMIQNAHASDLTTPSSIQFTMDDYNSEESFALQAGLSAKYMGFKASASASVSSNANERTVMVNFYEKMFEVVVEPPPTPGLFFSDAFTSEKLNEQIALGKIGPDNPPVYVSNIVYGRMMAFAFTSTASATEIKATLNVAYKGLFDASATLSDQQKEILANARISVTSLGGDSKATTGMISSGDWHAYFMETADLTSAYPISYTFRNLRDGAIAKVSEATEYNIKECELLGTDFSGVVLDSFEAGLDNWTSSSADLALTPGDPKTPQSIFYGYVQAQHMNKLSNKAFLYDVHYLVGPQDFKGEKADFYKGELSFWYKPDENVYNETPGEYCPWWWFCTDTLVQTKEPVVADYFRVITQDEVTTFDQVVLRGGVEPTAVLTLTYNPKQVAVPLAWQRHSIPLTNDGAFNSQCDRADPARSGCWLIEDEIASEEEIKFVLSNVKDLRIRASYPVQRLLCEDVPVPTDLALCQNWAPHWASYGYVGGYFDEVKLSKTQL
ncbi:MAG TPA: thiol-activated cytolysin family protein [Kofleriaceae bacterium]|nr:thiol-activated cytolysin family protein [Kofleriaceae bacterium]